MKLEGGGGGGEGKRKLFANSKALHMPSIFNSQSYTIK